MSEYNCLKKNIFEEDDFKILPIRSDDKFEIMKWRNEQVYHLRQNHIITKEEQILYFEKVLSKEFKKLEPEILLFSFLKKNICVGYGGLVHIDWKNKNAELSFLMNTELEEDYFEKFWSSFISLISIVSFDELDFNKIFIYSFDLRPNLYKTIEKNGFLLEAKLVSHAFKNNRFVDVKIHSKFKPK